MTTYISGMADPYQLESVEIFPLRYTVADLRAVPEEEAVYFLMCGQLQNDIVILMRQLLQARIVKGDEQPVRLVTATSAMLNMRILAARLAEGWPLIKDRFGLVFNEYEADITDEAKADLVWLRRYFSDKNRLRDVRDKAASHFDPEIFRDGFRKLDDAEPMIDFHAHIEGNTIYFSGEALMLSALVHLSGEDDAATALDALGEEVLDVARRFGTVVRAYLQAFSERHFAEKLSELDKERIVVEGQPRLSSFASPVYLANSLSDNAKRLLTGTSSIAISHGTKPT